MQDKLIVGLHSYDVDLNAEYRKLFGMDLAVLDDTVKLGLNS